MENNFNLEETLKTVDLLNQIVEELKGLNKIKKEINDCMENIALFSKKIEECEKAISGLNVSFDFISKNIDLYREMADKMARISENFNSKLDDAKRLETNLMMQKMDLLIAKMDNNKPQQPQIQPKKVNAEKPKQVVNNKEKENSKNE